ncbi:MAG: fumarylacetoacetate hydrolase family protein [Myxococcales bacterium]|nr:fumarylacetoacetate hydrolase family protein [Myxococcales bacterium]
MQIVRLALPSGPVFAEIDGDRAFPLDAPPWLGGRRDGAALPWRTQRLLAPVLPPKILCVGRNYAEHAKELGNEVPKEPLLFLKPSSSLIGPGDAIVLPAESKRVEHEAELGVVIGTRAKAVREQEALDFVYGYTCVGDITARDLQKSDGQWSRAKGFDTFCPVGPVVETRLDPRDLAVRCRVNGVTRQDGRTSQMVFSVAALVAYASRMMTLEPGDLLVTGTPSGVGPLVGGDRLEIDIEGIGVLACDVRG